MITGEPLWLRTIRVLGLTLWLLITLFPLYWIALTSFKPARHIAEYPVRYWPREFSLENYHSLLDKARFGTYLVNSVVVSATAATVATMIALLSGYVLSRFSFRGRGAVMGRGEWPWHVADIRCRSSQRRRSRTLPPPDPRSRHRSTWGDRPPA